MTLNALSARSKTGFDDRAFLGIAALKLTSRCFTMKPDQSAILRSLVPRADQ